MFYILLFLALIFACLEVYCAMRNQAIFHSGFNNPLWIKLYRWRWLVGLPFAALSAFISYPIPAETQTYQVVGFPLAVAALDEAGNNYLGRFTTPFFVCNLILWYFVPHMVLSLWYWFGRRKPKYKT